MEAQMRNIQGKRRPRAGSKFDEKENRLGSCRRGSIHFHTVPVRLVLP